jgi:hypothetical protein
MGWLYWIEMGTLNVLSHATAAISGYCPFRNKKSISLAQSIIFMLNNGNSTFLNLPRSALLMLKS